MVHIVVKKPCNDQLGAPESTLVHNLTHDSRPAYRPVGAIVKRRPRFMSSLVFGLLTKPTGNQMMNIKTIKMFHTVPTLLTHSTTHVDCMVTRPDNTSRASKVK